MRTCSAVFLAGGLALVLFGGKDISTAAPSVQRVPRIALAGPSQIVFDWTNDACEPVDVPDLAARAFRDANGEVQLITSHYVNRRMIGPDLDNVRRDCAVVLDSAKDPRPWAFNDRRWLAAPYTFDGTTVYALVHNEYQGNQHPGRCPSGRYRRCWYNAVTFAVSTDGGRSYADNTAPANRVASLPFRYRPDSGPSGIFTPSNIIRALDGYFYVFVFQNRADKPERWRGSCLMRTKNLADPQSWRAWNGRAFAMRFVDPYRERGYVPASHLCVPLTADLAESLTYSTSLRRYVRVGAATKWDARRREVVGSVYYSFSPDLVHWTPQRAIMRAEFTYTYRCGDARPIAYPALIDPASQSRSFETVGSTAYLYFTRFNYRGCRERELDRDLVRVPVTLTR